MRRSTPGCRDLPLLLLASSSLRDESSQARPQNLVGDHTEGPGEKSRSGEIQAPYGAERSFLHVTLRVQGHIEEARTAPAGRDVGTPVKTGQHRSGQQSRD